jgi:hypothetical protein
VRCLNRWLDLLPDLAGFYRLSEHYKASGDRDKWQTTLERALKTEDIGLNHAFIQSQLANYFNARREFKKAEPFAQAAV